MKLPSTLALGALLASGAAFAASTPSSTATATPAPAAQPAHKHSSAMHCEKLARNKGLTGDEEKKFVKECRDGKKS
jgi:Spy/CpxP family protein refolding chaperone